MRQRHGCPELWVPIPGGAPGHGGALGSLSWGGSQSTAGVGIVRSLPSQPCCDSMISQEKAGNGWNWSHSGFYFIRIKTGSICSTMGPGSASPSGPRPYILARMPAALAHWAHSESQML